MKNTQPSGRPWWRLFRKNSPFWLYASPFAVLGAAAILAAVVVVMAVMNFNREKEYVTRILSEKGAAIIRALEAGTRTGMMGGLGRGPGLKRLLSETAGQEDIFYIAITDREGHILAHGDSTLVGGRFLPPEELALLAPGAEEKWRVVREEETGRRSFLVYREFMPKGGVALRRGPGRDRGRPGAFPRPDEPSGMRRGNGDSSFPVPGQPPARPSEDGDFLCSEERDPQGRPLNMRDLELIVFVGMDIGPYEQARSLDFQGTLVTSATLLVLGFAAVVSLFWAQSHRVSKRLLRDTRAFASEVVGNMPAALAVVDPNGRLAMVNASLEALLGRASADIAGRPAAEVLPEALLRLWKGGAIDSGRGVEIEGEFDFGGERPVPLGVGVTRIVAEDGTEVGTLYLLRDLREVRALQEEVRRREKLAAIGNLAAGVAHEIRNPLSSIRGYASYFGAKFAPDSEDRKAAQVMVREVDRLNRVITELIEYSRPSVLARRMIGLGEAVEHSLRLIQPDAQAAGVRVETRGLADAPGVSIDPDRFSQALLNVFLNAVQSMPDGGTLTVTTGLAEDGRAFVETADEGPGIAPEDMQKVFNPYFTTKATGTGLGLAVALKIVEAHGGEIRVSPRPGGGTVFAILLPAAHDRRGQ
ncbi:ATP-binding protein [Desulfolutivibrio sulfoxidireducens]|uniref:ATP-binding protein n=1 Tax=Desulfolutivibrio sulfoxidireducens TaxID=2773299 RepID=UPI00159EACCA|nr:ATP-binding protein [Desulfolutivibrio sulfoxidireducens]QLA15912.1 PAS domain-containing protein [Desulfolutivibrio sulfoxidireducens]QLA20186.1 PAS domain-containing protein [Desulfolutivibrio sulfoxidireducens]